MASIHDIYYYTTVCLSSRSQEVSWVNSRCSLAPATLMSDHGGRPVVLFKIYQIGQILDAVHHRYVSKLATEPSLLSQEISFELFYVAISL